jgi:tetratricopeptide (TPR) repeat protein
MSGNRAIFDRAMEQSREAARQSRWDDALKNAIRAAQEFPKDPDARTAVAVALLNTGKIDKAQPLFEELRNGDPENIFYLGYLVQCHERSGNRAQAIATLATIAEVHQKQRRPAKVVETLRELLRLKPDADDQRMRLARTLQEANAPRDASIEYLALARRLLEAQKLDDAAQNAETALRLDGTSREAKELLGAIREAMSRAANLPAGSSAAPASSSQGSGDLRANLAGMTGALRSQQFAAEKLVADALAKQEAGDSDGAIDGYARAIEMGMERADVFYSLGLLYQERGDQAAAVPLLTRASADAEYALSAHFALGSAYEALGQLPQAANEYEQTIRLVDLESIGKAESEDLIAMYESAANIYSQIGDIARAGSLYSTLASFLGSKRWGRDRAAEFTQKARELTERNMFAKLRTMGTGALTPQSGVESLPPTVDEQMPQSWGKIRPITDFLRTDKADLDEVNQQRAAIPFTPADPLKELSNLPPAPKQTFAPATPLETRGLSDEVGRWVIASGKYLDQGLLEASLDACHETIRLNMEYLPIHLRMGEVFERQGRPEEALTKYQLLIDTFRVRGEPEKAIDVYFRFIGLSPDTVNARSKLADLLKNAGRNDEAADQLAQVASTYFRLGQTNKALEEYRRLLQWAPKNRELHAQYGLALLKLERYEAALGEFRKALELGAPNDPLAISRLNMTLALMGDQPAAVWDSLATLLEQLKQRPQELSPVLAEYRAGLLIADAGILHYILAVIQQHANQHTSALIELEQAQALLEGDVDPLLHPVLVHQAMADSYIALGQAEEALEQLRRGQAVAGRAKVDPSIKHAFATPLAKGDLVRRMAEAYAVTDDLAGAEQALIEAKKLLPYDRAIYTKLADVYFRQGKLNEALTQLEDLATHYEERQQLDRAIETLEYGLKLAPSHIGVSGRLARLQLRRGFLDKGVDGLVRLSELQRKAGQLKDAVASLQEAAQVHWMLGDHEKTRQLYDKIIQIAPNDIEARQWLSLMYTLNFRTADAISEKKQIARIYAQQRDYDGAIAELHQIIGLDQKDVEAYFMLGDMLMRREEFSQAVQLYGRMMKMEGIETERVEALHAAANRMMQQRQK